jgi:hypothetical protein
VEGGGEGGGGVGGRGGRSIHICIINKELQRECRTTNLIAKCVLILLCLICFRVRYNAYVYEQLSIQEYDVYSYYVLEL